MASSSVSLSYMPSNCQLDCLDIHDWECMVERAWIGLVSNMTSSNVGFPPPATIQLGGKTINALIVLQAGANTTRSTANVSSSLLMTVADSLCPSSSSVVVSPATTLHTAKADLNFSNATLVGAIQAIGGRTIKAGDTPE